MGCPECGSSLWAGSECEACGHGKATTVPPTNESLAQPTASPTAWDVTKKHVADLRNKAFWTAIGVTLLLAPSPAVITKVIGEPKAGLEEALTIWNVLWYTLPLTVGVAIDAGILMRFAHQPDQFPKTDQGKTELWCWLGGVLIGSMLLGGWLGGVKTSEWSQARIEEVKSGHASIDPSGRMTRYAAHGLAYNISKMRGNKWVLPVAIALGSLATIANYFTLYGPSMFFSSLVVGAFLGWVWSIKLPAVLADIDRASTPNQAIQQPGGA
jgi:hypothetical protein